MLSPCAALDNPLVVGDVGSLQFILEDYLEVDHYQVRRFWFLVLEHAVRFSPSPCASRGSDCLAVHYVGVMFIELVLVASFAVLLLPTKS